MGWQTVSGTTVAVSAALPATNDAAGFGALAWSLVGEITQIDGDLGKEWQTAEHAPIAQAKILQRKAQYREGTTDLMAAWDQSDAGQDIMRTAEADQDDIVSIRITKQNGDLRYFTAQVARFVERMGSGANVNQAFIQLLRQTNIIQSPA